MRIRQSLPETYFSEGFTPRTDIFGRAALATRLTQLFIKLDHGTVSLLDGRWGTGKSVFAKQWCAELKKEGVASIYFDAFGVDYIDNPFQAVSSAFIKAARDAKKEEAPAYKRFLTNAARGAKIIAGNAVKAAVKVSTAGVLDAAELTNVLSLNDELSSAAGDISEDAVKAMLVEHASSEATFKELRSSLADLPALLTPAAPVFEGSDDRQSAQVLPRLVIVIDELDRCRPDFALGVLEVLKHFFRADHVHFVLVTNVKHLSLSVKSRYGFENSAEEYLQKFFDFTIHFEGAQREDAFGTDAAFYAFKLLDDMWPADSLSNDKHELKQLLGHFSRAYDLTLRQIEAIVTNLVLAYLTVVDNEFRPRVIIGYLALIKTLNPALYKGLKTSSASYSEVSSFLDSGKSDEAYNTEHVAKLFQIYMGHNGFNLDQERASIRSELWRFNIHDPKNVIPYLANQIMDRFGRV